MKKTVITFGVLAVMSLASCARKPCPAYGALQKPSVTVVKPAVRPA